MRNNELSSLKDSHILSAISTTVIFMLPYLVRYYIAFHKKRIHLCSIINTVLHYEYNKREICNVYSTCML